MMAYTEKRVDTRADIDHEAKFKILSESDGAAGFGYESAKAKNISKGGLCLEVERKLIEGNVIRIELPSLGENKTIKAFCEVQWCRKGSADNNYEAGLSFIALREDDVNYLVDFIDNQNRAM
ncbi:MAG: PilZ domain-containing protein [Candidatus Goldiibacteriota bacterium]|jgi:hypothetical protein